MILPSASILSSLVLVLPLVSAAKTHSFSSNHKALKLNAIRKSGTAAHEAYLLERGSLSKKSNGKCKAQVGALASSASSVSVQASAVPSSSSSSSADPASSWVEPTTSVAILQAAVQATQTSSSSAATTSSVEWTAPTTSSAAPSAAQTSASISVSASASASGWSGSSSGLLNVNDATCGWSGATDDEPNGKQDWLNCGINGNGWTPPYVAVGELITVDMRTAVAQSNSVFSPCAPYIDIMYTVGQEFGIPPIMIASFAMQESTCNPSAVGQGGEQGLMQISKDKCGGAPGGNCQDPYFNIHAAMKYFSNSLNGNGGNVLLAIGSYNGWTQGMTYSSATAARWSSCCRCMNDLDYLYSFTNGFLQGKDGASMGSIHNLADCPAW